MSPSTTQIFQILIFQKLFGMFPPVKFSCHTCFASLEYSRLNLGPEKLKLLFANGENVSQRICIGWEFSHHTPGKWERKSKIKFPCCARTSARCVKEYEVIDWLIGERNQSFWMDGCERGIRGGVDNLGHGCLFEKMCKVGSGSGWVPWRELLVIFSEGKGVLGLILVCG